MKTSCRLSLSFAAALLAFSPALFAVDPNTLTDAERGEGWRLLFDGSSLTGWRGFKTVQPGAGWKVQDGALTLTEKSGDLVTTEEFGDFELSVEWKISPGGNSGIIYRSGLTEAQPWHTGPEYQVLDNVAAEDRHKPSHRAGSLYDLIAPAKDMTKPVGEWNESRLRVQGWRVEHWLNGEKLLETDLASAEGRALIAASKFKTQLKFATLTKGHLVLQDHGDVVAYRNIKVRELQ